MAENEINTEFMCTAQNTLSHLSGNISSDVPPIFFNRLKFSRIKHIHTSMNIYVQLISQCLTEAFKIAMKRTKNK